MAMIDGTLRMIVHVPGPKAGHFHFSAQLRLGTRCIDIPAADLPTLVPELRPYVAMDGADHAGVPAHAETNAWYHAAGVAMPGAAGASRGGPELCVRRYAKLMRIDEEYAAYHIDRLARMAQEFPDEKILRNEVRLLVEDAKPRWQREATAAIAAIPALLETIQP